MKSACLLVIALAGCGSDSTSCDVHWDSHCEHPIDRLVIPRLRDLGIEPRDAAPGEYCRRLSIDLLGRVPTDDELAACIALPDAAARVDATMANPLYERTMRRAWGEHLGYNNFAGWSDEIVELDGLVGKLYRGELRYDDFAATVAVHPGFLGLHPDDNWAMALWRVFLGRPARADEVAGFRPLAGVLQSRLFCEGHIFASALDEAVDDGLDAAAARAQAIDVCLDLARPDWSLNFCGCNGVAGCSSSVLGTDITLHGSCPNPDDQYADGNLHRVDQTLVPGDSDECPDGSHRAACRDVEMDYDAVTTRSLAPLPLADAGAQAELGKIGKALVTRGDFWEAASDREARLLLGWWQTSFRHPDTDLPEVRRLLADHLREHGSVRELQRLLLTSILYTAPADAPLPDVPDFAMAPTKLMAAETWLDSAASVVGEPTGICDFRWVTPEGYYDTSLVDARLGDEAYYDLAIKLGGCNAERARPSLSSVGMAFTEATLARMLCAYGRGIVPPGADLATGARQVIHKVLGRDAGDAETGELVGEMQACMTAGACADTDTAVRWLCARALESTEFSTY